MTYLGNCPEVILFWCTDVFLNATTDLLPATLRTKPSQMPPIEIKPKSCSSKESKKTSTEDLLAGTSTCLERRTTKCFIFLRTYLCRRGRPLPCSIRGSGLLGQGGAVQHQREGFHLDGQITSDLYNRLHPGNTFLWPTLVFAFCLFEGKGQNVVTQTIAEFSGDAGWGGGVENLLYE
jgi:hypothetical protein